MKVLQSVLLSDHELWVSSTPEPHGHPKCYWHLVVPTSRNKQGLPGAVSHVWESIDFPRTILPVFNQELYVFLILLVLHLDFLRCLPKVLEGS